MEMEVSVDDKEIKYTFWHQEDTLNRTELIESSRMKKKTFRQAIVCSFNGWFEIVLTVII